MKSVHKNLLKASMLNNIYLNFKHRNIVHLRKILFKIIILEFSIIFLLILKTTQIFSKISLKIIKIMIFNNKIMINYHKINSLFKIIRHKIIKHYKMKIINIIKTD
jgi:hypothetical protein